MVEGFSIDVALREGGRVNTLGTLVLKAGIRQGAEQPVLAAEDFRYLLGSEGCAGMRRLLLRGRPGLYLHVHAVLPFGENNTAIFRHVVVDKREMPIGLIETELKKNGLALATQTDIAGFLSLLRGHYLQNCAFWVSDVRARRLVRGDVVSGTGPVANALTTNDVLIAKMK